MMAVRRGYVISTNSMSTYFVLFMYKHASLALPVLGLVLLGFSIFSLSTEEVAQLEGIFAEAFGYITCNIDFRLTCLERNRRVALTYTHTDTTIYTNYPLYTIGLLCKMQQKVERALNSERT